MSGGSNSTSASIKGLIGGGEATPGKSALSQRKASFILAGSSMGGSRTEEGLALGRALSETIKGDRKPIGGDEAQAAAALGLALEANRGAHGSSAVTREDTFDASAGRFPLQQS